MKKIYISMLVIVATLLSSCEREKDFRDITVGENELAFVMQGASTRSAESAVSQAVKGITIPMGTIDGEALYLEETIQDLNPSPATRGIPVYNENLGLLHKTLGVYAVGNFGDAVFQGMDETIHNGGWRYNHNYDGSPWPNKTDPVDFYLRLPAVPTGLTFTKRENKVTEFTLESPLDGLNQQDVVMGQVSINKMQHDDALPEGYEVQMKHVLTGIKFANGHPNDNPTKTIITRVEIIGLYGKGDCSIDEDGNITWDKDNLSALSTDEAPFYLKFDNPDYDKTTAAGNPDGTVSTDGDKKWDSSFDGTSWTSAAADHNLNHPNGELTFWFIPQDIPDDLVLKVYFTVKTPDSVDGFLTDACHTIPLGAMLNEKNGGPLTWAAGQLRTYTLAPYDVDVDIKDTMTEDTKSNLHIANTGNVDEYVRMLIMGNWYGWKSEDDKKNGVEPSILVGYKYKGDEPNMTDEKFKEMVLPWYREGYDLDNDPLTPNEDPYGHFDESFALANLKENGRDGKRGDWADASGGYYYTMPIGPGEGANTTESATKDLFKSYHVDQVPEIWLATSATTRVKAVGVHLRMEIVVQSIAVPKNDDGTDKWWLQAWYEATGVNKLDPDYTNSDGDKPNADYKDLYEHGEYDPE